MSVIYDPSKLLKKIAPISKIKKMIKPNLSLKKTAFNFVSDIPFIDKKGVESTALKVIKSYKERIKGGESKADLKDDPALLIDRVQNEITFQLSQQVSVKYHGKKATWLPSSADEPDPEHQLNYGKEYIVGEGIDGEEPGDRYGCQCGAEIQTEENELDLTEL